MITVNFVYGEKNDSPIRSVQEAVEFLRNSKDGDSIVTGSDHFINTCFFYGVGRLKKNIQFQFDARNIDYESLNNKIVEDSNKASDVLTDICDEYDDENGSDDDDIKDESEPDND